MTGSRAAALDEQGIRDAYTAHAGELYGFALRCLGEPALAEEAVQETFLRAWRAAERFDPEVGSRRTWLFAIARNVIIDSRRSPAARRHGLTPAPEVDTEHDPIEQTLLAWQVEEALRRIGEAHRTVLIETYFRARPYAEVAFDLGVPEGTVKSRVFYALRALRNALEEMGYES